MTSWMRALAGFARCERPTSASLSASIDHPGRLLQGPDEKNGRFGFVTGFMTGERSVKLGLADQMSRIDERYLDLDISYLCEIADSSL